MKIVTLNIWGGRVNSKLKAFFEAHNDVDVWCFQEVYRKVEGESVQNNMIQSEGYEPDTELFEHLQSFLPNHTGKFCEVFQTSYGIAMFVRKGIDIIDSGEVLIARGDWESNADTATKDHHRKLQWAELESEGKKFLVANVHLTHRPAGKRDCEKRIKQSRIVIDFLDLFDCPKVLAGDFNLLPDTESVTMFEHAGMKNLVKEFGVTSTRTELYTKDIRFADYVLTSSDVVVTDFKVLPDVVSDHSPLELNFNL